MVRVVSSKETMQTLFHFFGTIMSLMHNGCLARMQTFPHGDAVGSISDSHALSKPSVIKLTEQFES
jgi:hypothetical protein